MGLGDRLIFSTMSGKAVYSDSALGEPFPTFIKLWIEGASLIPTGNIDGKKPLVKFAKNRLPLDLIIKNFSKTAVALMV